MTITLYNPTYDQLEAAYAQATAHAMPQAWRRALDRGYDLLLVSDAIRVEVGPMGGIVLAHIPSQHDDGKTYAVNGTCSCTAGQNGRPCAHRAAKRLLNIAHEQAAANARKAEQTPLRGGCAQDAEYARGHQDGKRAYECDPNDPLLLTMEKHPYDTYAAGWVRGFGAGRAFAEVAELFAD
jgi:hypothetical protein